MSDNNKITWYGDGIYSKNRRNRHGKMYEQFFVRMSVDKRVRVFKAGRTKDSANRLRDKILDDPSLAIEKRDRLSEGRGLFVLTESTGAKLIKQLRMSRPVTLIADDLGVSRQMIYNWRNAAIKAGFKLPKIRPALQQLFMDIKRKGLAK